MLPGLAILALMCLLYPSNILEDELCKFPPMFPFQFFYIYMPLGSVIELTGHDPHEPHPVRWILNPQKIVPHRGPFCFYDLLIVTGEVSLI